MKNSFLLGKYEGLYNRILIFSIVSLWLSIQLPAYLENNVAYGLILTIGIIHGANDLKIFFDTVRIKLLKKGLFIAVYATVVAVGIASFFFIPHVILSLFILASGYHFGEEHFEKFKMNRSIAQRLLELFYGLTIILAILYINNVESLPIINELLTLQVTAQHLLHVLLGSFITMIALGIGCLRSLPVSIILREILYLLVLYILFVSSTLVWSFAIYFVLWHSVPSIHHQIEHLYGEATVSNLWQYIKTSLLYWLASLLFLGGLYYFLFDNEKLFLTIIVAFLGGITFPHMFVMNKLHRK